MQGVGFRDALRREARRAGVRGWVRNRADGSVEALLQGDEPALERILAWARRGPPLAEVRDVHASAPEPGTEREYATFEIWRSA